MVLNRKRLVLLGLSLMALASSAYLMICIVYEEREIERVDRPGLEKPVLLPNNTNATPTGRKTVDTFTAEDVRSATLNTFGPNLGYYTLASVGILATLYLGYTLHVYFTCTTSAAVQGLVDEGELALDVPEPVRSAYQPPDEPQVHRSRPIRQRRHTEKSFVEKYWIFIVPGFAGVLGILLLVLCCGSPQKDLARGFQQPQLANPNGPIGLPCNKLNCCYIAAVLHCLARVWPAVRPTLEICGRVCEEENFDANKVYTNCLSNQPVNPEEITRLILFTWLKIVDCLQQKEEVDYALLERLTKSMEKRRNSKHGGGGDSYEDVFVPLMDMIMAELNAELCTALQVLREYLTCEYTMKQECPGCKTIKPRAYRKCDHMLSLTSDGHRPLVDSALNPDCLSRCRSCNNGMYAETLTFTKLPDCWVFMGTVSCANPIVIERNFERDGSSYSLAAFIKFIPTHFTGWVTDRENMAVWYNIEKTVVQRSDPKNVLDGPREAGVGVSMAFYIKVV